MSADRLEVSVTFDPERGYIGSAPELRQPVTALSLGGLRRRIEALMCKIWYLISRTVSEDDAHRGNTTTMIARSALGFALHGRCRKMCP
jgi:hypothetical protein